MSPPPSLSRRQTATAAARNPLAAFSISRLKDLKSLSAVVLERLSSTNSLFSCRPRPCRRRCYPSTCIKKVYETIKNFQEPMEESSSEESSNNQGGSSGTEWKNNSEEQRSDSNPSVPLAQNEKEIDALNTFLEKSGFPPLINRLGASSNYQTVSGQYRSTFKRALTSTILAALRAITDSISNQNKLFQDTKRS